MPAMARQRPLERVAALENAALADLSDPNPLVPLLALMRHADAEVVHKTMWALYRVLLKLEEDGRVASISGHLDSSAARHGSERVEGTDAGDGQASQVRSWVRSRLLDFVDSLLGLLRDAEASLRTSAVQLLFGMLPALAQPSPLPYFRIVLRGIVHPSDSLRGAVPSAALASEASTSTARASPFTVLAAAQVDDPSDVLPADVVEAVSTLFAENDDLRLLFFREALAHLPTQNPEALDNLLSMLMPLVNLPRVQGDLNTFFIPAFAAAPKITKTKGNSRGTTAAKPPKKKAKVDKNGKLDTLPAWMETYDSASSDDDDASQQPRQRVSALGTHAAVHSLAAHTAAYTDLWEAVLSANLDAQWTRKVLVGLHGAQGILSHMRPERRVRVADWLGGTVDRGGPMAMLAMNGLYVLMTQYNLDYPNFYERLYSLLDADLLHVRYRARFFRLLDIFLRSALLPAALIASMIRRLSRLALTAPPAGAILVIPFIYNLFKRHPACMPMLHRLADDADSVDPYNADDPSPYTSRAIESSAYELAALRSHYLASVSTLAKIFEEQFTKPEFNMEDFLDHGYGTMFDNEVGRKIRSAAVSETLELHGDIWPAEDAVTEIWAM